MAGSAFAVASHREPDDALRRKGSISHCPVDETGRPKNGEVVSTFSAPPLFRLGTLAEGKPKADKPTLTRKVTL